MRKASSVVFEVIAGFLFYSACLMVFAGGLPMAVRMAVFLLFFIPGMASMLGGLVFARYRHWQRDAGIVVASASAFTLLVIITTASMFAAREFKGIATPGSIQVMKDYHYVAASIAMAALAALGVMAALFDRNPIGKSPEQKAKNSRGQTTVSGSTARNSALH